MKKVGIATGRIQAQYGDKEAVRIAKEIGADAIDFALEDFCGRYDYRNEKSVYALPEDELIAYFTDIKNYADELGIEICQTHGRGLGFLGKPDEDEALVKNARIDCMVTKILGAPVCVIHPVSTMWHMEASPEYIRELNYDMFLKIMPFAKEFGVKIAAETFGDVHGGAVCDFFGNIDEFIAMYDRICAVEDYADWFTICVDTGHTNKATKFNDNPKPPKAIRMLGKNVTCLHLNDNNTDSDQHLIPFTGKKCWQISGTIDWDDTLNALDEIGYDGVYNLELDLNRYGTYMTVDTAEFAIKVMKNFLKNR